MFTLSVVGCDLLCVVVGEGRLGLGWGGEKRKRWKGKKGSGQRTERWRLTWLGTYELEHGGKERGVVMPKAMADGYLFSSSFESWCDGWVQARRCGLEGEGKTVSQSVRLKIGQLLQGRAWGPGGEEGRGKREEGRCDDGKTPGACAPRTSARMKKDFCPAILRQSRGFLYITTRATH